MMKYNRRGDNAIPMWRDEEARLVASTASYAQVINGCLIETDCEDDDLFLFGREDGSYSLRLATVAGLEETISVGDWLFCMITGQSAYKPAREPAEARPEFVLLPGQWGQLEAMRNNWTPIELVRQQQAYLLALLEVASLGDEPGRDELKLAYEQGLLAQGRLAQLGRTRPAVDLLLGVLLDNEASALASLRGSGQKEIRGHAQQIVDELIRTLHLLTGQAYSGLLRPTPPEKLRAQVVGAAE